MKKLEEVLGTEELSVRLSFQGLEGASGIHIGNDIVAVRRIADLMDRPGSRFIQRAFTPVEIEYCSGKALPEVHFAGRWAAKEAVFKALQLSWTGPFSWKEIEIRPTKKGPPIVGLSEALGTTFKHRKAALPQVIVSISHCSDYAFATALAFENRKSHLEEHRPQTSP